VEAVEDKVYKVEAVDASRQTFYEKKYKNNIEK
jgi:hypothetical protein